jgi:hypothetical protein
MKINSQNGFAPVFIIIVVIVFVGAGIATYYGLLGNKPKQLLQTVVPGTSSISKLKESDFVNITDPLIRKHFAAQYSKSTFRVISTSDGLGNNSQTVVDVQYVSDTDFRMHMSQIMDGKNTQETITMADTTYMKDPKDNAWWKEVNKADTTKETETIDSKAFSRDVLIKETMDKSTVTYTKLGEEPCEKLTCYKYEEKNSAVDSGTRIFWFDTKELLLRKETHGYGEFTSQSEYSYDNISINEPSPVKDVPEGKSIYEMMIQGYADTQESGVDTQKINDTVQSQKTLEEIQKGLQNFGSGGNSTDIPIENSTDLSGE